MMNNMKKEISKELFDAIMEQSMVSAKIAAIMEKEDNEKKLDFWQLLDMEIHQSLYKIKYNIGFWCNYHDYQLDIKWLDAFKKNEEKNLYENWRRSPFQSSYTKAITEPLNSIMIAKRNEIDKRCNDKGDSFYTEIGKLC